MARTKQPRAATQAATQAAHLAIIAIIFFLSACALDPSTIVRTPRVAESAEAKSGDPAEENTKDGQPTDESEQELPPEITAAVEKPEQIAAVEIDLTNFKERLLGLDGEEITELLGKPKFERSEPPAQIWQYQSSECFVDLFLYEEAGDLTVDHVEVRGKQVEKTDEKICFTSLLKTANGGDGKPAPIGPIAPKKSSKEQPAPGAVKKPAVQQENIPDNGGEEIAPPILVPEEPEAAPDKGPEEPVKEPAGDSSKKSGDKAGPKPEKISGDEEDVPEVDFKLSPAPQDKSTAKPEGELKKQSKKKPQPLTKTEPVKQPAPEQVPEPEEPPVSVEKPIEEPLAEPAPETKPETEPAAEPEPTPAAGENLDSDSLDSEKTGDAPTKLVKKPVQDELPGAPKIGTTESEDDLLEDPAP